MANYLYNGVELPALPEWDKTVYPKSLIVKRPDYTFYEFYCAKGMSSLGSDIVLKGGHKRWVYLEGGTQWEERETMSGQLIILSANVLWDDGDPAPVPVVPEITPLANSYIRDSGKWSQNDYYERVNGAWVKRQAYARMDGKWAKVVKAKNTAPGNCLTFSSAEPFTVGVSNSKKNWDGTLYYSIDKKTWVEWDGTAAIASAEHEGEQRIYMRGSGNSKLTGGLSGYEWVLSGSSISCSGNIENLLDFETVANGEHPTMAIYCYNKLFYRCTSLITAPELPATTLASYCYREMFEFCTNLTTAPELPATTLAYYCYWGMFNGCTSLTTAPELPATQLEGDCYNGMFASCTSLVTAPELPATTLAKSCYAAMFSDCTNLTTVPALPANNLAVYCYSYMFRGCTSIKLSKTQTDEYQTPYRIPTSGSGDPATSALLDMFTGTGGSFADTPSINTTYYTANAVV